MKDSHLHPNADKASPLKVIWVPAILMTMCGLIASFIALYPGTMSVDSFYMYGMGLKWRFNDWQHPFIPLLMSVSRILTGDTSLLLFFQLGAFWMGVYFFSASLKDHIGIWALLVIFVGISPVVLSQAGYLHKTPLQASLFMFTFGLCYHYYTYQRHLPYWAFFLMLSALFLGTTIRVYTYICVIPILIFLVYILLHNSKNKLSLSKTILITLSILALFYITENIIVYKILNAKKTYKLNVIFKYDLAGIMAYSGKIYGARLLKDEFASPTAVLKYHKEEDGMWRIIRIYKEMVTKEELAYLFKEWLQAIKQNPEAYLEHRRNAISRCLGLNHREMYILRTERTYRQKANKYDLKKNRNVLWGLLKKSVYSYDQTILFKPWFWLATNLLALVLSTILINFKRFARTMLPHLMLVSSGTLFFLTYLFICLDRDFRFVYWGTVATAVGSIGIVCSLIGAFINQRPRIGFGDPK
jgi:hypothetical protein